MWIYVKLIICICLYWFNYNDLFIVISVLVNVFILFVVVNIWGVIWIL